MYTNSCALGPVPDCFNFWDPDYGHSQVGRSCFSEVSAFMLFTLYCHIARLLRNTSLNWLSNVNMSMFFEFRMLGTCNLEFAFC